MSAQKEKESSRKTAINYDGYCVCAAADCFATVPAMARSISTESFTRRNNVLGFFIPHFA
jgi:hypothetical protein